MQVINNALRATLRIGGPVLVMLVIVAAFLLAFLVFRRVAKRRLAALARAEEENAPSERRCRRCGYDLQGLAVPKCPECGTLYGFDKPIDALGLAPDEIDAIRERQRAAPILGDNGDEDLAESPR